VGASFWLFYQGEETINHEILKSRMYDKERSPSRKNDSVKGMHMKKLLSDPKMIRSTNPNCCFSANFFRFTFFFIFAYFICFVCLYSCVTEDGCLFVIVSEGF
jgi:hypothetical protein